MKYFLRVFTLFILFTFSSNCQLENSKNDNQFVEFKNRKIDLKPYVEGFPYINFNPFYEAGKLYYYDQDSTTLLKEINLSGELVLS